jgi:hypothetical protein
MPDDSGFDKDEAIFLSIMYSFHAAAMQQLGKIANPFTGKVERDLDAAHGTIDVLLMFRKKTQGNLSDRERRTLTNLITELQLNYVDEAKRESAEAGAEGEEAPPKEDAAAAESAEATPPAEEPVATPPPAEEPAAEKSSAEADVKKTESGEGEKKPPEKKSAKKGRGRKKKKEG